MPRLLTCPDCGARYRIPDGVIGADGKTVRCQRCGETWYAEGEAATPDALELADLEAAEGEMEFVDAPAPVGAVENGEDSALFAAPAASVSPSAATLLRERRYRDRHRSRLRSILLLWLGVLGLLLAAGLALVAFRQAIVERVPSAAAAYHAIGLHVSPLGLDLTPVEARQVRLDGTDYLVVSGEVVNLTRDTRPVPLLRMELLGPDGQSLADWSVDVGAATIGPRARLPYVSEYPNPPIDGVELRWRFD